MSARDDILQEAAGEKIEGIVFGAWGWGSLPLTVDLDGAIEYEYDEIAKPIPPDFRGRVLTWEEAEPFLNNWSCYGGYGAPDCYAITVWTTHSVIFIVQYDGSTRICSVPRHPVDHIPSMPGG